MTRIFSAQSNLTAVATTRTEIRKLVQAFLNVRATVIPKPPRPRPASEESQESQEDYGDFDLNLDDPELLAALGDPSQSIAAQENKTKDKAVAEVSSVVRMENIRYTQGPHRSSTNIYLLLSTVWFVRISTSPEPILALRHLVKTRMLGSNAGLAVRV